MTITQESFDATLAQLGVFGEPVAFHNAMLQAVEPGPNDGVRLTLEIDGQRIAVRVLGQFDTGHTEHLKSEVGKVGCAVRASEFIDGQGVVPCRDAVFFRPYLDQSLRRRPEIDRAPDRRTHRNEGTIGWSCDARGLFLAPLGIIPGEHGRYIPDATEPLTLFVPPEFNAVCEDVGLSAEQVLRGFIADAAGLHSLMMNPRADGYSSNGSDERDHAESYIERAWGHRREEAERWKQYREDAQESEDAFGEAFDRIRDLAAEHDIAPDALAALVEQHFAAKSQ